MARDIENLFDSSHEDIKDLDKTVVCTSLTQSSLAYYLRDRLDIILITCPDNAYWTHDHFNPTQWV